MAIFVTIYNYRAHNYFITTVLLWNFVTIFRALVISNWIAKDNQLIKKVFELIANLQLITCVAQYLIIQFLEIKKFLDFAHICGAIGALHREDHFAAAFAGAERALYAQHYITCRIENAEPGSEQGPILFYCAYQVILRHFDRQLLETARKAAPLTA